MALNKYKDETKNVCKQMGWEEISIENLWMFFIEEIGELASAIRRVTTRYADKKKPNVESEVMDVLSYLFQIADKFDIDLDSAWDRWKEVISSSSEREVQDPQVS